MNPVRYVLSDPTDIMAKTLSSTLSPCPDPQNNPDYALQLKHVWSSQTADSLGFITKYLARLVLRIRIAQCIQHLSESHIQFRYRFRPEFFLIVAGCHPSFVRPDIFAGRFDGLGMTSHHEFISFVRVG